MRKKTRELVQFVRQELAKIADPEKSAPMQRYMRSEIPFLGINKPERVKVVRRIKKCFPPEDRRGWEEAVLALWKLPHREERYVALDYLALGKQFHDPESLTLMKRLIREGAWWDFVDFVASQVLSPTLLNYRAEVAPVMEQWIDDEDMWVRRAALLSQLKHKDAMDERQLFDHCLRRSGEKEFFIRKAIGWALRDYSWTRPESVRRFLEAHGEKLSPLSRREGGKRLGG